VGVRQAGIDRDGRFRMAHDAFRLVHPDHLPLACAACLTRVRQPVTTQKD